MGQKLHRAETQSGDLVHLFFHCPGCDTTHGLRVKGPGSWTWNESLERPTISPSLLVDQDRPERRCHSFIRDGRIEFLGDCHHELKGKTVELPDWTADW